jgi:2-haloacid dehalogenase
MQKVMSGERGWTILDDLHRSILEDVLLQFGVDSLNEEQKGHLNRVWSRLSPWPDSVAGLTRLKVRFVLSTLSNGNIGLLTRMAKNAGLPWDCILSAEVFKKYKPDPEVYLGAARIFDLAPDAVMMVAAHHDDLAAARKCGFKTAYVERPAEFGMRKVKDVSLDPANTLHAKDIVELAELLGC